MRRGFQLAHAPSSPSKTAGKGTGWVFVETWASEAQWRAHMDGAAIKRFHASAASKLIVDFSLIKMSLVVDGNSNPK